MSMINLDYNYEFRVASNMALCSLLNMLPFKPDKVSFDYRFTVTFSGHNLCAMFKLISDRDIKIGYFLDYFAYASRVRLSNLFVDYKTTIPLDYDYYRASHVQK